MANIEHLMVVKGPVHQVYEALTTREGLSEVWTDDLQYEAAVGAVNEFRFGPYDTTRLKVVELVPVCKVQWECVFADSEPEWIGTTITFELKETNGKTVVELNHANWKEASACYRSCNYHWAMVLLSLKQYCEGGRGTPCRKRSA